MLQICARIQDVRKGAQFTAYHRLTSYQIKIAIVCIFDANVMYFRVIISYIALSVFFVSVVHYASSKRQAAIFIAPVSSLVEDGALLVNSF